MPIADDYFLLQLFIANIYARLLAQQMPTHRHHRRRMRGRGIGEWLSKANAFLRKTKLVSRVAGLLGSVGLPYAGAIGKAAGVLGYGRRRHHKGSGLGIAGGSLRLRWRKASASTIIDGHKLLCPTYSGKEHASQDSCKR